MDDLTPSNPTSVELPEKPISPALSPHLKLLLVESENTWQAVRTIAENRDLKAETVANLPVLKAAATQKAGQAGVRQVIGKRFALYPQPDRSQGEWLAWWEDYFDVLADVPWAALEAGMAVYVRDPKSEFMPKPGKLLELAKAAPVRVMIAYERALKVAEYTPPAPIDPDILASLNMPQPKAMPTGAEAKRMGEEAASQIIGARARLPVVELPSIAGTPDETGITPQMRELLARQRGAA
jgi:hypothetical protein